MIVVVLTILSIILKCIAVGVIQRQRPQLSLILIVSEFHNYGGISLYGCIWFISQSKTGVVSTRHSPFPSIWFIITVAALMTACLPMHL